MDTLRRWIAGLASLPRLLQAGGLIFGLGLIADLAHHALPHRLLAPVEPWLGPDGMYTHLAILVGMVVVFLAVVLHGLQARPNVQTNQ